jgi:hypothetical protein
MPTTVLAKDPASLSAKDALTVGWAYAPIPLQWSTSSGGGACLRAAGVGTVDFFGLWMPAGIVLNIRTPSDDRNLVLCPLFLELLKAEKLPDFALHGVLFALNQAVVGRPAVVAKLLDHDAFAVLMGILHQASPTELVATAGHLRRPHGGVLIVMKHLVETAQSGSIDLSAQLLASGFIDTLMSALSAVQEVGADSVNGVVIVWSALGLLALLDGKALPQIEDKLRGINTVRALRYAKGSNISGFVDFGMTAGTFATIVAGASLTLCLALLLYWYMYELARSNTHDCSQSVGEGRGQSVRLFP